MFEKCKLAMDIKKKNMQHGTNSQQAVAKSFRGTGILRSRPSNTEQYVSCSRTLSPFEAMQTR